MRQRKIDDERLSVAFMHGVSQRNYEQVAKTFADSYEPGHLRWTHVPCAD